LDKKLRQTLSKTKHFPNSGQKATQDFSNNKQKSKKTLQTLHKTRSKQFPKNQALNKKVKRQDDSQAHKHHSL
jgi:hypothetical protein